MKCSVAISVVALLAACDGSAGSLDATIDGPCPADAVCITIHGTYAPEPGCVMCTFIKHVVIMNPDTSRPEVVDHGVIAGSRTYSAFVAPGATALLEIESRSSPSSSSSQNYEMAGIEPGDRLVLGTAVQTLPSDCVSRQVTVITDAAGSHWDDPDAASVDARSITGGNNAVPQRTSTFTLVDSSTATTYAGTGPVQVDVISCTTTSYAELRPLL